MMLIALRWLHMLFMASWFGASLFVSGDVRRTLEADSANLELLAGRLDRAKMVAAGSAWLTLLTGIALIFAVGGFAVVPPPIHIGLLLTLIMLGLGGAGIGRTSTQIATALREGAEPASLLPLTKRLAAMFGVFHLLWLLTFTLMVFRHVLM